LLLVVSGVWKEKVVDNGELEGCDGEGRTAAAAVGILMKESVVKVAVVGDQGCRKVKSGEKRSFMKPRDIRLDRHQEGPGRFESLFGRRKTPL
jgi:hypothetical protein